MLCFVCCCEYLSNGDDSEPTTKRLWCLYRLEFYIRSDERITAQAHKGLICHNSFVPTAKKHPVLCRSVLYFNWLIVRRSTHCVDHSLQVRPLQTFPAAFGLLGRLHLIYIQLSHALWSLPPQLAWVSTSVSLRVCSADWLRRLVPISSMAAVWVCTAVLFISSIPERTFSWMKFSSCTEQKQAVNIVSYGNQTSLIVCTSFIVKSRVSLWNCYTCLHVQPFHHLVPCRAKHSSSMETCCFLCQA